MLDKLSTSQRKIINWLGFLIIVGIGFMLVRPQTSVPPPVADTSHQRASSASQDITTGLSYENRMELELTAILQQIQGVGVVQAFITLERGPSIVVAESITEDSRTVQENLTGGATRTTNDIQRTSSPVILRMESDRKEVPLVIEEYEPLIRGVLVVATGAADPNVRYQVAKAVQTVLQIPMYRIEVLPKVN